MPEELLDEGNALGMLRAEHDNIRALLGNVYERDAAFAREALVRLLQELEVHDAMERQYFFPFCEQNAMLVSGDRLQLGMADTEVIREMATRLESMDVEDPNFAITMERLIHSFQHHCFAVEENLFIALEGGDWTMHNLLVEQAIQMRSLREQMLLTMQRPRATETSEFQKMQHRRAQEMGRGVYPARDVVADEQIDSDSGQDVSLSTEGDVIDMGGKTLDIDSEEGTAGV
jgi:hypothetical protein